MNKYKGHQPQVKSSAKSKPTTKSDKLMDGIGVWASFYKANPQRFVSEYLGINLKIFQQILLFMMSHAIYVMYLAARGQGKTFLTAIYCVVRAILYPETKIIISSGQKSQSREVIEKIDDLQKSSPNLQREISVLSTSANDSKVEFRNGSWIKVVASNDGARSKRANLLIVDEFRMVDVKILNTVLRKFLTAPRQPKYLNKPEYKHLQERNKEIYLTSCWYKNHWSWQKVGAFFKNMKLGKSYFVCGLPYQLSIKEGLLMKEQVLDEMSESDFDKISFDIEMGCMFFGESAKSYFKLDDLQKNRKLFNAFYPLSNADYIANKTRTKQITNNIPKKKGEIRLIGVDVALMGGNANDNSIFTCMRLIPSGEYYLKQVVYIESVNGEHSEIQSIKLKRLFADFSADYVIIDTNGNGMSIYDTCAKILYDKERDVEYEAWKAYNNEEMANRALSDNAMPVVYSIKVSLAKTNHEIATWLRDDLQRGKIRLLTSELDAKDLFNEKRQFAKLQEEEKVKMLYPYVQTSILVNEMVSLEWKLVNGYVKVVEVGKNRKDRFSSLAYCNFLARTLEGDNLKEQNDEDATNYLFID